jgi:hypothetical protein
MPQEHLLQITQDCWIGCRKNTCCKQPKIVGLDAARTLVANNPRLLGSSHEKQLKPRHAECQDAGVPIDKGAVEPMAMCTEKKWSSSMAFQNAKPLKE